MRKKKIKTQDLIRELVSQNFVPSTKTNFFKKVFPDFLRFKEQLLKEFFDESLSYHFSGQISFPYNELLSLINQKEEWTKEELVKLLPSIQKLYKLYILETVAVLVKEYK